MTVPEPQLMPWPGEHYGCRVVELGEDGGYYAVAGPQRDEHVSDRRALAAVLHYLRWDCSFTRADFRDLVDQVCQVDRRWVTVTDDENEPWQWSDRVPGAWSVTYVETWS